MKSNRQMFLLAWTISLPCVTFLFFILMMCLWEYRVWVGISLLTLISLMIGVYLRGVITEQNLRIYRFNHHEETPLDMTGKPMVLRPDMRENPNQQNHYQPQTYYQGYQTKS